MSEFLWKKHLLQWLPAKTDMSLYICSVSSVLCSYEHNKRKGMKKKTRT